jgi:hypothetical protein
MVVLLGLQTDRSLNAELESLRIPTETEPAQGQREPQRQAQRTSCLVFCDHS